MFRWLLAPLFCCLFACADGGDAPYTGGGDTSAVNTAGQEAYLQHCAACHGEGGQGTANGPAILHELHHSDADLIAVMLEGKGDMPAAAVTEEEAQDIVDYMRDELNRVIPGL